MKGEIMTYNLFISHSWAYSTNYEELIDLLNSDSYFKYNNYSVPKDDPIHTRGTDNELYQAIKNKMQPASVVLILAGIYVNYSKWIDKEIKMANNEFAYPKKIIAVEPWGSVRTSTIVKNEAAAIVKWQTSSIIQAIRELT
jgi:hypothetical protein